MKQIAKLGISNLILLLAIAFGLSACGGNDSNKATKADKETSKSAEPVWKVPTGADPDYPEPKSKMEQPEKPEAPMKKAKAELIWKVPTGADPIYATKVSSENMDDKGGDAASNNPVWVVPTGADPNY